MQREFIFTNQWSDLVFENRNKNYGAYVLRKRLPDNILIGYIIAVLFMGSVVFTGYQFSKISAEDVGKIFDRGTIVFVDGHLFPPPVESIKKTDPAKPPSKPPVKSVGTIVSDKLIDPELTNKTNESTDLTNSKDSSSSSVTDLAETNSSGKEKNIVSNSAESFDWGSVKKVPEFKGGTLAMMKFIQQHVHYPEKYLSNGDGGTVYVSFVIDTTGRVVQVKPKYEINGFPEFTSEAIEAVSKMPLWIPGQQNGRNVSVILTLPIKFSPMK